MDSPQTETFRQQESARRQPFPAQRPAASPLRDWLACVLRAGYVLLFVLGGLFVWWGILAAVGDAAAARAAGLACLVVFVLWLVHGVVLGILLARAVLDSSIELPAAVPPGSQSPGVRRIDAASGPQSGSGAPSQLSVDPEAETVRSHPDAARSDLETGNPPQLSGEVSTVHSEDHHNSPRGQNTPSGAAEPESRGESSRWDLLPQPQAGEDSTGDRESDSGRSTSSGGRSIL